MIATVHYNKLRMGEFIQFLTNVTYICRDDPVALTIDTHLVPLEESIDKLNSLYRKAQGSALTKELVALDERRDNALILLTMIAKGYSRYSADEAKRKAAKKIYKLITRHGKSIYRFNYQAETGTIFSLVNKLLSEPGLPAAVTTLGVQSEVDELKTSNEQFDDKFLERIEKGGEGPAKSATEVRKKAKDQYRRLIKQIEALAVISGPEKYKSLIKELNTLIEKYNREAHYRTIKSKDGEDEWDEIV